MAAVTTKPRDGRHGQLDASLLGTGMRGRDASLFSEGACCRSSVVVSMGASSTRRLRASSGATGNHPGVGAPRVGATSQQRLRHRQVRAPTLAAMETETAQSENLDDVLDSEGHDAFGGGPPPTDHDVDWRPDKPGRRPVRRWIAAGVAAVAVATGAFFGVRSAATHSSTASANAAGGGAQAGGFPGGPGGPGGPGVRGDGTIGLLQSVDGSTLTLQSRDGQTVKVTTTSSTQVTKVVNGTAQPSSLSALTVGDLTIV